MDRSVFELFRLDGKVAIVTGAHAWLGYDIACAFAEAGADVIITSRNVDSIRETAAQIGEKYHVDLKRLNRIWLEQAGVRQIDVSQDCTACQSARFWSHRLVGGSRGSLANIIMLTAT